MIWMRIAILTAHAPEAGFLKLHLEAESYECHHFGAEQDLYKMALQYPFELLLLGRMAEEMNLVDILTRIRANLSVTVPILVCTDREFAPELLCLSNTGVDDIQCRLIAPGILIARISAMLGRTYTVAQNSPEVNFGEYRFDHSERGVFISGSFINLTRKQYDFALLLSRNNQDNVGFQAVGGFGVIWKPRAVARRLRASTLRWRCCSS